MLYIAENLKRLRKEKDFTQEYAAEALNVSPQSVSKWERGETLPDITLLPALSNLYGVSVDALIGMDIINDSQTRNNVFSTAHKHIREGDYDAAAMVYKEALKTYPNDEGMISDYAITLALGSNTDKLTQAIALCQHVLTGRQSDKVHHTTRAALCFIYLKAGYLSQAIETAESLPHRRESREAVIAQLEKSLTVNEIDAYLTFVAIGGDDEQDIIEIDFGTAMTAVCTEHDLIGKIESLRGEFNAPRTKEGLRIIPQIRIRDKTQLPPKHVRVRNYADYLLDEEFANAADATDKIVETLRKLAQMNTAKTE